MKKYIKCVVAASLVAFVGAAFANAAALDAKSKDPAVRAAASIEKSVGSLTQEQQGKIVRILQDRQGDLRKAGKDDKKKDAIFDQYSAKVRAVLTPEQQAKFDKGPGKPKSKK